MHNSDNQSIFNRLEALFAQLFSAERVYGTLVTSDRHPSKRDYFKHRYFQYSSFAAILKHEILAVTDQVASPDVPKTDRLILNDLENSLLERPLTGTEVDELIVKAEKKLILKYQELLAYTDLPNTTNAILQSQAEELNNEWQKLKSNLEIEIHQDNSLSAL
ncbi:MAG: hypothetical protein CML05_04925 [Pseudozobellia sp.]|nr:hypothetical protein [Pseudozobellia sp.]|tara:strand:+ start:7024 stop:7509 length:486 start_codon:yes stop_codon:yes gene_type:complete